MMTDSQLKLLRRGGWLSAGLHGAGLVLALVGMRPGTPLAPLDDRLAILASAPLGWTVGWAVWMLCALALLFFFFMLGEVLPRPRRTALFATLLVVAAVAVDLLCDAIQLGVLPRLAARDPVPLEVFLAFEDLAGTGGTVVANGLYSVALLVMTLRLSIVPRIPRLVIWTGMASFFCGMVMAAAGLLHHMVLVELSTGPTIALSMVWTIAVTRALAPS